ncbi:hypothetical protein C3B44_01665 [Corynebacterium yudongzhengii]|uniref:DUF1707 and DUF2154 domain-containing protein n=1 Tax=Corynebacterium yudongzhengii TaxID=2080740 RepID=A0A2U1T9S7_9CORY|nr:DUF1707 domain-containing protein [Corynebacterium yudongzhengii]AWB81203.1 hypothetical protein C3B44_01665 [Corynebacterium yudongzhengii]PWC02742.1 DUF1707 and DUF2154 domain-containing protein [Corynebacterium yudongzhengii]
MDDNAPDLSASDADCSRVMTILSHALDAGQLDYQEYDERLTAARGARFRRELTPLTRDLDIDDPTSLTTPQQETSPALEQVSPGVDGQGMSIAIIGGNDLTGNWACAPRHTSIAIVGGVEIHLTEATLASAETTITIFAAVGGVEVYVPEDMHVDVSGLPILGGSEVKDSPGVSIRRTEVPADAPRIHVRYFAVMGGVDVIRVPRRPRRSSEKH